MAFPLSLAPPAGTHRAGFHAGDPPGEPSADRPLIGFGPADGADTRAQIAEFIALLRAAEPYATDAQDFSESYHGDYAELLSIVLDADPAELAAAAPYGDDPAGAERYQAASWRFERAVVEFCTDLALGDPAEVRGHVTTGGSEGLLFGLRAGRQAVPGAAVHFADGAHPSARRHAALLGLDAVRVPARGDGTMDPRALRELAAERGGGAIVVAGAADDVAALRRAAGAVGPVHLHADAGEAGLPAAFAPRPVAWDLRSGADSLSFTAHRMLGLPVPCGVALDRSGNGAEAGGEGRPFGAASNPLAITVLWAALRERGYEGLRRLIMDCYAVAGYAVARLNEAGCAAGRPEHSLTVHFTAPRHGARLPAGVTLTDGTRAARLSVTPQTTRATVDALCAALTSPRP